MKYYPNIEIIHENQDVFITYGNYNRFIAIYAVLFRLGFDFWEVSTICCMIERRGYYKLDYVDLETIFNDLLENEPEIINGWRKDEKALKRKMELILESHAKAKEKDNMK